MSGGFRVWYDFYDRGQVTEPWCLKNLRHYNFELVTGRVLAQTIGQYQHAIYEDDYTNRNDDYDADISDSSDIEEIDEQPVHRNVRSKSFPNAIYGMTTFTGEGRDVNTAEFAVAVIVLVVCGILIGVAIFYILQNRIPAMAAMAWRAYNRTPAAGQLPAANTFCSILPAIVMPETFLSSPLC